MKARDVMTTDVAVANPDTPTREIAALLLKNAREARRDWWLALLAEGNPLHEDFLASLRMSESRAREIMSAPVVTVTEDTPVAEIAAASTG